MKVEGNLGVSLTIRGEVIFLNGKSIRPKPRQFQFYRYLTRFYRARKIGGIKILQKTTAERLLEFLWCVVNVVKEDGAATKIREFLEDRGFKEFEVEEMGGVINVGSDSDDVINDVEHIIAALYKRLLKFTEVAFENLEQAAKFDLSPAESSIQELVLMADEDLVHMLRLVSVKRAERPLPTQAVNACFMAVAWGRALRLPMSVVVELGGAALAHPLTRLAEKRTKPGESVEVSLMRILDSLKDVWPLSDLQRLVLFEWTKPFGEEGIYLLSPSNTKCYAHFFSRMVRIVGLFEEMTTTSSSHRQGIEPAKRVYLPDEALSALIQEPHNVDITLIKLFVNWIGVYPIGTLVELQSGEIAQVFAGGSDPLRFQRPIVSVLKNAEGELLPRPTLLDLSEVNPKLGIYKKSIRRSVRLEDVKIPEEYFQLQPLRV